MGKSVIEDIYFCDRVYYEEVVNTAGYVEAKEEFSAAYEKLLDKLPDELKAELDEVFYLHSGVADAGYAEKFKDGFKLGFNLAAEALLNKG